MRPAAATGGTRSSLHTAEHTHRPEHIIRQQWQQRASTRRSVCAHLYLVRALTTLHLSAFRAPRMCISAGVQTTNNNSTRKICTVATRVQAAAASSLCVCVCLFVRLVSGRERWGSAMIVYGVRTTCAELVRWRCRFCVIEPHTHAARTYVRPCILCPCMRSLRTRELSENISAFTQRHTETEMLVVVVILACARWRQNGGGAARRAVLLYYAAAAAASAGDVVMADGGLAKIAMRKHFLYALLRTHEETLCAHQNTKTRMGKAAYARAHEVKRVQFWKRETRARA